ncbi:hypothetical protein M408DRAFT_284244 [Serendipita vermifera MAFF 305830]|uniref:Uncharacterized protein n=1 Tax=Serendipita vermifera MAFF 305830 TaxID=933852 RepID=A0A0C3ACT0_SERVB|nr:hypothetical protein M408DRAFT_284244 [Serendipita vermifera MAFF 305830]
MDFGNWSFIWTDGPGFEASCLNEDPFQEIRKTEVLSRERIIMYALFSDGPLIPIPKEVTASYRSGISRSKLGSVLDHIQQTARPNILYIFQHLTMWAHTPSDWRSRSLLLCHDLDAVEIIKAIVCKWDFQKDCPLPNGVKRVWIPAHGWLLLGSK